MQVPGSSFITLEGIEGCGKTAQSTLLKQHLEELEIPYLMTHEPGGTAFGQALREILLRADNVSRRPVAELLLYLADRYQHLAEVIEPALAEGKVVISDRYHDATLAYQGFARGVEVASIRRLAAELGIRTPDVTLFLDLPVEEGLRRARERNSVEDESEFGRFEAEALEFHHRVREGYLQLMAQEPERIIRVDACGPRHQVFRRVRDALQARVLGEEQRCDRTA